MTKETFEVIMIDDVTVVERRWDDVSPIHTDSLIRKCTRKKCKNTAGDKYNKNIGIVVGVLKTLGFSRRIISKISDVLLEEANRIKY